MQKLGFSSWLHDLDIPWYDYVWSAGCLCIIDKHRIHDKKNKCHFPSILRTCFLCKIFSGKVLDFNDFKACYIYITIAISKNKFFLAIQSPKKHRFTLAGKNIVKLLFPPEMFTLQKLYLLIKKLRKSNPIKLIHVNLWIIKCNLITLAIW